MAAEALPSGEGEGRGAADLDEDEEESSVVGVAVVAEFFGTGWEKKKRQQTAAKAVRAVKTMATAPKRLFIFCLTS